MGNHLLAPRARGGSHCGAACLGFAWLVAVQLGHAQEPAEAPRARLDLRLPEATHCEKDAPVENRIVLDITQDEHVLHEGKVVQTPTDARGSKPLHDLLAALKARPTTKTETARIGGRELQLVDDPILLRADRHTEWHHVALVMQECSRPELAFWNIQLGVEGAGTGAEALVPAPLPRDQGKSAAPVEYLRIGIINEAWGTPVPRKAEGAATTAVGEAFDLEGHEIAWQLGPRLVTTEDELLQRLQRMAKDGGKQGDDPDQEKQIQVVIEPKPGVTYGDAIRTADVARKAGLTVSGFGSGQGLRKK